MNFDYIFLEMTIIQSETQQVRHFTTICAWCKKVIFIGPTQDPVSHGICEDCVQKLLYFDESTQDYKVKM